MAMSKIINQQNPPLPKKKRVDSQGNDRRRLIAKSGNATLIIASGITGNGCTALERTIRDCITKLGGTCECSFKAIM
jgi:hypothetical protein